MLRHSVRTLALATTVTACATTSPRCAAPTRRWPECGSSPATTGDDSLPSYLHFISRPGHLPQPAGSWSPALPEPEPPWFDLLEQCFDLYVAECCALS